MPYYEDSTNLINQQNRERRFANWRKWFIWNHTQVDVNGSDEGQKETIAENICVKELRGIFTGGYVFAMIQTKQTFEEMYKYLERKHEQSDGNDLDKFKHFLEIQNEMFKFIDEKIEDSYCLNTGKEFPISDKLVKFLKDDIVSYNFLK